MQVYRRFTDAGALIYERHLVPAMFVPWVDRLLTLAALRPGERVLDAASGTGVVAHRAAALVGPAGLTVGQDLSPARLALAQSLPPVPGASPAWVACDVGALPFADARFDVICCQQGLQHFPDRGRALRELRRVLAPDGRLAISVWGPIERSPGFAALAQTLARYVSPEARSSLGGAHALGDGEKVSALLRDAGFRDVTLTVEAGMVRFPSVRAFVEQYIDGTRLAHVVPADAATRAALVSDMETALGSYLGPDGLAFPIEANIALAQG